MRYRPSVSLDQAGYLPIHIQKGERGQKINREGKKRKTGAWSREPVPWPPLTLFLFSPSALHCAALAWSRLPRFSSRPIKKHKKRSISSYLISYPDLTLFYIGRGRSGYEITSYLDWTSLVNHKGFLIEKENFSLRNKRGKAKAGKKAHLACSGSQSEHRICFIFTLMNY